MRDVLALIQPTSKEKARIQQVVRTFLSSLKIPDAKISVGGSFAKDTWLRGMCDIDIFVQFEYSLYKDKSHQLSDILEKSLKRFHPERLHGSRDYFRIYRDQILFEIVPILYIKKA